MCTMFCAIRLGVLQDLAIVLMDVVLRTKSYACVEKQSSLLVDSPVQTPLGERDIKINGDI